MPDDKEFVLPHNSEAEIAVLGALLLDYNSTFTYIPTIKEEYFSKRNAIIFKAIKLLHEAGKHVDIITVLDELKKHINLDEVGGAYYISGLSESTPSAANIKYYIDIIADKALLRKYAELAEDIKQKVIAEEPPSSIGDYLVNSAIVEGLEEHKSGKIIVKGEIEKYRKEGLIERLSTDFIGSKYIRLDEMLAQGYCPATTSVIFGRPRHGKSALKSNLTVNQCREGLHVGHVTPEQGFAVEMDRLTSIISGIPLIDILKIKNWARLKDNQIISDNKKEHLNRIRSATDEINSWNIFFHSGTVNLAEAKRFIVETNRRFGLDIVYIDLFDRIDEVASAVHNKPQVVTKCISFFETLAIEQKLHICYLVQSGRSQEGNADRRPTLRDLKESGSYEERAWLVLSVFRECLVKKELNDDTIEITINKQKNGPEGVVELIWNPETLLISEDF